jgi:ubiquinone biosynthesis protein COQ4
MYANFMEHHEFDPLDRPTVRYVDDDELAYVLLRYRQSHDFYHVLFDLPPTVLGEVALKWVEMLEFKLGGAAFAALGSGRIVLNEGEYKDLTRNYVPWAIKQAKAREDQKERSMKGTVNDKEENTSGGWESLLSINYEAEFETDIDELRKRLCITPFPRAVM